MMVMEFIRSKRAGAWLGVAVLVLALVSLIVYLVYATSIEGLMMPWVIVLLVAVIACEGVQFFIDNDYTPIAAAGCAMASLGCFAVSPPATIGSIVDYFQKIVMFGNPDKFGIIIATIVLTLTTSVVAVVACFFSRVKKPAEQESPAESGPGAPDAR